MSPESHDVLLIEPPNTTRFSREKMADVMLKTFNAKGLCFCNAAALVLLSTGRTTGVVVTSGHILSHVVPIFEGHVIPSAIRRFPVAGRDLIDWMAKLLTKRGYSFTTTREREVVRDIKEKLAYVALDFDQEMQNALQSSAREKSYELPDGLVVTIDNERFRCPEALFQPSFLGLGRTPESSWNDDKCPGIHTVIYDSVQACDTNLGKRLLNSIVVSGSNTLFPGFVERLSREMSAFSSVSVKVTAAPENSAWKGGTIFAASSNFQSHCVSRKNYETTHGLPSHCYDALEADFSLLEYQRRDVRDVTTYASSGASGVGAPHLDVGATGPHGRRDVTTHAASAKSHGATRPVVNADGTEVIEERWEDGDKRACNGLARVSQRSQLEEVHKTLSEPPRTSMYDEKRVCKIESEMR